MEVMREANVPAGKLFTAEDMLSDEQYAARRNIVEVEDRHRAVPHAERCPAPLRNPRQGPLDRPEAGPAQREVFTEVLGMDEEDLDGLRERGIV